jgi:hypothetical protein
MLVEASCVINPDERVLPDELAHVFTGVRGRGILRSSELEGVSEGGSSWENVP